MRSAVIALCLVLAGVAHASTPREQFEKAKDAFRKKDCDSARPNLVDVLNPPRLADAESLFEAYAMLGACYADSGERELAKKQFEKALQLKPREILDSLFYSERAVRLFDDTKADIENRARKDAELRELQAKKERLEQAIRNTRLYKANPFAMNFAPFGLGQWQNERKLKAALFAGGQIVTLGTSVGVFTYLVNKYGIRSNQVPLDDGPRVRRLQQIHIGTGIAFWSLYVWSVVDAIRDWEPNKRIENDDELLREIRDDLTKQRPAPKKAFYKRLRLSPMVTSDGVGIGIGWEN